MMDDLMTSILTSAKDKTGQSTPLDLRWSGYTRHTCDSFLEQEDMRSDDAECSSDDDQRSPEMTSQAERLFTSSPSSNGSSVMDVTSGDIVTTRQKLAFSIANILGGDNTVSDSDTPAVVSSPHCNGYLPYQKYIIDRQTKTRGVFSLLDLSPIRGVSMLNTRHVFWCHSCNCLLEDPREVEKHQTVHRLQRSKCNLKRSVFSNHGYVTSHEYMDDERIKCGLCNKVISACFFNKHQRLHDGHICSVCNQEFSTHTRLADHMNVHSGITPFVCKICDRRFAKRSSLTQHLRYHRDSKCFACHFCSKSFNSKYACAVHERLHTGEKPFKCMFPSCTRAYPQKIQLKLHINSHHR